MAWGVELKLMAQFMAQLMAQLDSIMASHLNETGLPINGWAKARPTYLARRAHRAHRSHLTYSIKT